AVHTTGCTVLVYIVEQSESGAAQGGLVVRFDAVTVALQDALVAEPPVAGGVTIEQAEPGVLRPRRQRGVQPGRVGLPAARRRNGDYGDYKESDGAAHGRHRTRTCDLRYVRPAL